MNDMKQIRAWTDYPIIELGDAPGERAPVRECKPLDWDGNKYATVLVGGITTTFKSGYVYERHGRCGEVPVVDPRLYQKDATYD